MREREDEWTGLMRSAISGDSTAYHRLLKAVTPVLRAAARRGLARAGQPVDQSEDIVQDILLAVHLKRHTWDASAPFAPWLFAIARNKLIDALRRRGRRVFVNIDDFAEVIPSEAVEETVPAREVAAHLEALPARQRDQAWPALRKLPGGLMISIGLNEPWFTGVCGSRYDLMTVATAFSAIAGPTSPRSRL